MEQSNELKELYLRTCEAQNSIIAMIALLLILTAFNTAHAGDVKIIAADFHK